MPQSDALVSPSAHLREGENGRAGAGRAVAAALVIVGLQCWAHTEGRRRGSPPEGKLP